MLNSIIFSRKTKALQPIKIYNIGKVKKIGKYFVNLRIKSYIFNRNNTKKKALKSADLTNFLFIK